MPANLTPQYLEAEQKYRNATTIEEKESALEEMIATLPKHKGTEKIYADLKSKLAKIRREKEQGKKGGPSRHSSEYVIKREGAGQIVLIGPPNVGKSSLLKSLTNADVEITEYPFATRKPVPGMMKFEDVPIQLIDTPSISPEYLDPYLMPFIRIADGLVICIDISSPDCLDQPAIVLDILRSAKIEIINGTISETSKSTSPRRIPGFITATKSDLEDAQTALELLREVVPQNIDICVVSIHDQGSLERFKHRVFKLLGIVRVYSKAPGKDPDMTCPFLLPTGSTVLDFAEAVHKDFRERFGYARVWGAGKHEGQRVARDYIVCDKDIVELHIS